jgi:hypothetical protein
VFRARASIVLDRGVLILHASIATLDPRLDFFAGTVAGACIPRQ